MNHVQVLGSACLVFAAGCSGGGRTAPHTPSSAAPGRISVTVGNFEDTDQNRYLDSTAATVYVWAAASGYPIPMRASGSFHFQLQDRTGKALADWEFGEAQAAVSLRELAPGPGYVFALSLVGRDAIPESEAELVCTFTPKAGGPPIVARPGAPIAIGPTSRGRRGG